jgi:hypothetical protein
MMQKQDFAMVAAQNKIILCPPSYFTSRAPSSLQSDILQEAQQKITF